MEFKRMFKVLFAAFILGMVFVVAYGTTDPAAVGHTWGEMICDTNLCVNISSGFVGIGTVSPSSALSVSGNSDFSGDVNITGGMEVSGNINSSGIFYGSGSGLTSLNASVLSSGKIPMARMPAGGTWSISEDLSIGSNFIHVDNETGKVGIGRPAVTDPLEVNGSVTIDGSMNVGGDIEADSLSLDSNASVSGNARIYNHLQVDGWVVLGIFTVENTCSTTNQYASCTVTCPSEEQVISGGCSSTSGILKSFFPTGDDEWQCNYDYGSVPGESWSITAETVCIRLD